ncbi:MAG: methyltransferase domain-containing protein [Peptostreptococcaceae bacterium]
MKDYDPYKLTAISRKDLSVPMRKLLSLGILDDKYIIDFGCGIGQDVEWLRCNYQIEIEGYDKYNLEFKNEGSLKRKYNVVTCNYVLNVIPELEIHKEVLELLRTLADEVYISVRADKKAIKDTWIYIDEFKCWKTPRGSYQRFYDRELVSELIGDCEYIIDNSSLKLIKLI